MEEIQGLTDLQLQEADEEKERILAQLQELEKKVGRAREETHEPCCQGLPSAKGQLRGLRPTATSSCTAGSGACPREAWVHITGSGA